MTRKGPRLEVEALLEPGVTAVTEADVEVTALIRLRLEVPPEAAPAPLHVTFAPTGPGANNAAPVLRALSVLRPGDRVSFPGGRTHLLAEGELAAEVLRPLVEEAFARPEDTAAAALAAAKDLLVAERKLDAAHRLVFVPHSPVVEPMEPLLGVATALTERQIGLDAIATSPGVDLGLMVRLANLSGGDVSAADGPAALEACLRQRLTRWTQQYLLDARLELEFAATVVPARMYRVHPTPTFLGNVRLTPTDRRLVLDPGPVAPGHEPAFVLTMTMPRRRAGRYRLLEIASRHRGGHRLVTGHQVNVVHTVTDEPALLGDVEAAVIAARDRAEPAGWVEEAGRAFLEGDHRRVATTLERFARRLLELGRATDAQAAIESRSRYLRSGHLDRTELNRLRRLAGVA